MTSLAAVGIHKVTTKRCPQCGRSLPRTRQMFVVQKSPWTGGDLYKHCRRCDREKQRAYYREHRDAKVEYLREWRQRKGELPGWREEKNAQDRARYAKRQARAKRQKRTHNQYRRRLRNPIPKGPGNQGPRLEAEPFVKWLRQRFAGWPNAEVCAYLDIDSSQYLRLIRGQSRKVSLAVVDRAFTAADANYLMAILYPLEDGEEAA